jgi:hypothetical protein
MSWPSGADELISVDALQNSEIPGESLMDVLAWKLG